MTSVRGDSNLFPVLESRIFFDHAAVSPITGPAADAIATYATEAAREASVPRYYAEAGLVREHAARMINASVEEIATIPNTSTGVASFAGGLDWSRGGVVISNELEFPANRYPWEDLRSRGVAVVNSPLDEHGRLSLDSIVNTIKTHFRPNQTNVLAISHVQYATGQRVDLAPLAEACHDHGGYIFVDAIQSIGAIPLDVQREGIDFLAADGHKWMLGPEGIGFLYCRKEHVDKVRPIVPGWLAMDDAFAVLHGADFRFEYRDDARRFEPGCWNIVGMKGLAASLKVLLDLGVDEMWKSIRELDDILVEGLRRLGCTVESPTDNESRSGVVIASVPDGGPEVRDLEQRLKAEHIDIAARRGRLRIAPHGYNTPAQVEAFLGVLGAMIRSR